LKRQKWQGITGQELCVITWSNRYGEKFSSSYSMFWRKKVLSYLGARNGIGGQLIALRRNAMAHGKRPTMSGCGGLML